MNDELVMLDESNDERTGEVYIIVEKGWSQVNNVITIPKKDAVKLAINLLVQADIG